MSICSSPASDDYNMHKRLGPRRCLGHKAIGALDYISCHAHGNACMPVVDAVAQPPTMSPVHALLLLMLTRLPPHPPWHALMQLVTAPAVQVVCKHLLLCGTKAGTTGQVWAVYPTLCCQAIAAATAVQAPAIQQCQPAAPTAGGAASSMAISNMVAVTTGWAMLPQRSSCMLAHACCICAVHALAATGLF